MFLSLSEAATSPLTTNVYSRANADWSDAVSRLNTKKEQILNDPGYQQAINDIKNAKTEKERQAAIKVKHDYIDSYFEEVKNVASRMAEMYPSAFDSSKYAAVIQLMNMETGTYGRITNNYGTNPYLDYLKDEEKTAGRDAAIATMAELGFVSPEKMSLFGYYAINDKGEAEVWWNDPLSILNMKKSMSRADDLHWAAIHNVIQSSDLYSRKQKYRDQIDAIYAKGKLSNADYNKIDSLWIDWNAIVMNEVAPYVNQMTPESAINNTKVLNELASLIEVPGEYKKDKNGKFVTNNKLGEGSAKEAYIKNYIRSIFKVNNSGYNGGKNYSDRK